MQNDEARQHEEEIDAEVSAPGVEREHPRPAVPGIAQGGGEVEGDHG
jgi:hypothetical protein